MPEMHSVTSGQVRSIGYDHATQELHVEWKDGRTSIYDGVPADVGNSAKTASSVGSFLNQRVKGTYGHRYT